MAAVKRFIGQFLFLFAIGSSMFENQFLLKLELWLGGGGGSGRGGRRR